MLHEKGFSPVWVRSWTRKLLARLVRYLHMLYAKGFSPVAVPSHCWLGAAGVAVFSDPSKPSSTSLISDAVLNGPAPDRLGPSPCAALDFHAWKETAPADRDRANGAARHKDGDVAMLAFKISRAENGQVGGGGNQRGCRATPISMSASPHSGALP